MCYSHSVSFIELLRIFASYMVKFVLKYCVQKKSYGNKTGFVRPGHILCEYKLLGVDIVD